jgi:hypothetical protein
MRVVGAVALSVCLLVSPVFAGESVAPWGEVETRVELVGGTLSVDLRAARVADVLEAIAARAAIDLTIAGPFEDRLSMEFAGLPLEAGLERITRSNSDLTFERGDDGSLTGVVVVPRNRILPSLPAQDLIGRAPDDEPARDLIALAGKDYVRSYLEVAFARVDRLEQHNAWLGFVLSIHPEEIPLAIESLSLTDFPADTWNDALDLYADVLDEEQRARILRHLSNPHVREHLLEWLEEVRVFHSARSANSDGSNASTPGRVTR